MARFPPVTLVVFLVACSSALIGPMAMRNAARYFAGPAPTAIVYARSHVTLTEDKVVRAELLVNPEQAEAWMQAQTCQRTLSERIVDDVAPLFEDSAVPAGRTWRVLGCHGDASEGGWTMAMTTEPGLRWVILHWFSV